jgi:hypothetical protein
MGDQFQGELVDVVTRRMRISSIGSLDLGNAGVNAFGVAQLSLGPPLADEVWEIGEISISSDSSLVGPCACYIGDNMAVPSQLHSQTLKGTGDTWNGRTSLFEGNYCLLQWTNMTPGASVWATFLVTRKRLKGSAQAY